MIGQGEQVISIPVEDNQKHYFIVMKACDELQPIDYLAVSILQQCGWVVLESKGSEENEV